MRPFVSFTGSWNIALFEAIHATPGSPHWAIALASAAIDAPMWGAVGLTLWRLSRQRFWQGTWPIALAYGLSHLIEVAVSAATFHPRPFAAGYSQPWIHHAANNSMPSSHVVIALILALGLFARREAGYGMLVAALAALVAWGRIYLGLHWPEDVLGSVVSAVLSFGAAFLLQRALALRSRLRALPAAGPPAVVVTGQGRRGG